MIPPFLAMRGHMGRRDYFVTMAKRNASSSRPPYTKSTNVVRNELRSCGIDRKEVCWWRKMRDRLQSLIQRGL
jgi:hypothetical protein